MTTISTVTAIIDEENNAEEFWAAFRDAIDELDSESELACNCRQILQHNQVELLDSNAITEFQEFVCDLPGFSDGPDYATDAILFQADYEQPGFNVVCTNPAKSAAIEACWFSYEDWTEADAMQQFATDYGLELSEVAVEKED